MPCLSVLLLIALVVPGALGARVSSQMSLTQGSGFTQNSGFEQRDAHLLSLQEDADQNDLETEEGEFSDDSEEEGARRRHRRGKRRSRRGKIGLIVVDVQDCFTEKGIGLGNPRGDATFKNNTNAFVAAVRKKGGSVVLLQDYHPVNHISFGTVATQDPNWKWINDDYPQVYEGPLCEDALAWDNKEWFDKDFASSKFDLDPETYLPMLHKCKNTSKVITQPLFPAHCVQGTDEVKHTEGLCESAGGKSVGDTCEPTDSRLKIVRKGMNPGVDSFGGIYDNRVVANMLPNTDERTHWGLFHYFKQQGVTHVIHIGIADDFCVKDTAFAAASKLAKEFGIKSASVVPSLSYGIFRQLAHRDDANPKDQTLVDEYTTVGVKVETEKEALARLGRR